MESHDRDKVSRVLEAALASLKAEAHVEGRRANLPPVTSIRLSSNDAHLSSAPVVILIHPNPSQREGSPNVSATQIEKPSSCACSHDGSPMYPEFERFPLSEPGSRDPSKMCFIEPDQVCVGSGACEALGY